MQFFGRVALGCAAAAGVSSVWEGARVLRGRPSRGGGLVTIFSMASLQFASFGLIGELLTRLYFNDAKHRPYVVRRNTLDDPTLLRPVPAGVGAEAE
jgi:hypothetical protein